MKKLTLLCALACLPLLAQTPDLKRNQKLQKLAMEAVKAQSSYFAERKTWADECAAKGLELRPITENLMDCVAKPTAQPQQPPRPAPAKPEAK